MLFYILIAVLSLLVFLWQRRQTPEGFPPGYSGIPFLGVLPYLADNPAVTLMEWSRKLGPIFYAQMGSKNMIILNNYETVHECLVNQYRHTSDRGDFEIFTETRKELGIAFRQYDNIYKALKKLAVTALKGFGIGKDEIEEKLQDELERLRKNISVRKDAFNPKQILTIASTSILSYTVFGKRMDIKNPRMQKMMQLQENIFNNHRDNTFNGLTALVYHAKYLPAFRGAFQRFQDATAKQQDIFKEIVDEHEKNFDQNNINDAIDLMLLHRKKDPNNPAYSSWKIVNAILDIFEAGTFSISSTLSWCILYLAQNKTVQDKLQKEIDDNIESNVPYLQHYEVLPLTCSFIDEINRHRTMAPLALFHKSSSAFKLFEYKIPSKINIVVNRWAVHNDPKTFPNPGKFIPERFIDKESGKYVRSDKLIPFGIGPRKCLGYQIAEKEVFIYLCGILQRFKIEEDKKHPLPSFYDSINGVIYSPKEFKVKFVKR